MLTVAALTTMRNHFPSPGLQGEPHDLQFCATCDYRTSSCRIVSPLGIPPYVHFSGPLSDKPGKLA